LPLNYSRLGPQRARQADTDMNIGKKHFIQKKRHSKKSQSLGIDPDLNSVIGRRRRGTGSGYWKLGKEVIKTIGSSGFKKKGGTSGRGDQRGWRKVKRSPDE